MSLPEWHGWLIALEDKRARVVGQLLEWIARDDRVLTVGFAAEAGIGYAKGRASLKASDVPLGPIDLEKEKKPARGLAQHGMGHAVSDRHPAHALGISRQPACSRAAWLSS